MSIIQTIGRMGGALGPVDITRRDLVIPGYTPPNKMVNISDWIKYKPGQAVSTPSTIPGPYLSPVGVDSPQAVTGLSSGFSWNKIIVIVGIMAAMFLLSKFDKFKVGGVKHAGTSK